MADRPVIGITKPHRKDNLAYAAVAGAVRIAGGEPVALTPSEAKKRPLINGVVFGGGDDIFPMLYDGTPKQGHVYNRDRDALEIAIGELAIERDIPSLGICRGAQMMNVVRGGALHADVAAEYEDAAYPDGWFGKAFFRKTIHMEPDSCIAEIVGAKEIRVNSLHKQAIKHVGDGMRATAREKNGVIQTIEAEELTFFMGVQFHPEFLIYKSEFRAIFEHLVKVAADREPVEIGP